MTHTGLCRRLSLALFKTPIVARSLTLFTILLLLSLPRHADAQVGGRTVGETEIIKLATERSPSLISARLKIAVGDAKGRAATLRANPSLAWNREHFPGTGGESEDSLVFSIPVDLSGRRDVRQHLSGAAVSNLKSQVSQTQSEVVVSALSEYYLLLALQEEVNIQKKAVARLREAARIVSVRLESGQVSGYDQSRIEIEVELAASSLRQIQSRAKNRGHALALRLGLKPAETIFAGDLLSRVGGTANHENNSPVLKWLKQASSQAQKANQSANKSWMPTLSLSGGLRLGLSDDTQYGYIAGISMSLPIFSTAQALRKTSEAQQRLAESRVSHMQTIKSQQKATAQLALDSARSESKRLSEGTSSHLQRIERGAQSGYREGRLSLVELLDAQKLRSRVETRQLAMTLTIKQAQLAVRAAQGDF